MSKLGDKIYGLFRDEDSDAENEVRDVGERDYLYKSRVAETPDEDPRD